MIGIVEAGDFDPAGRSVELQRLGQGAVGVELQHRIQKARAILVSDPEAVCPRDRGQAAGPLQRSCRRSPCGKLTGST